VTRNLFLAALALLAALIQPTSANADERILSFDSDLAIQPDGSLDVTENIRVRAEGSSIRRGIYRDFPTHYLDRYGNLVVVDFKLLYVERDGHPEPSFTENLSNGVRINTGNDEFLSVPAEYTYSIHYHTDRQLGFFPDHDELYWNVTGLGWGFPIDEASARVTLSTPVPSDQLRLDAYTGPAGAKGQDYHAKSDEPGVAVFQTTRGLDPYEGITIVVGFPKGIYPEPTGMQRFGWFLRDNSGVLIALPGMLLIAAFYLWSWTRFGRDPDAGPIFPRYEPPQGFCPGELRMLWRMSNDKLCFSADVVDMAVRGYLDIHEGSDDTDSGWQLIKKPNATLDVLTMSQRSLATALFKDHEYITLTNTEATRMRAAIAAHQGEMSKRLQPRFYQSNGGTVGVGFVASLLIGVIAFVASAGHGIPALVILGIMTIAMHILFARLLKAPTAEGRKLMDELEGLKMYMSVAERDELKSMPGPNQPPMLDAKRYEMLLPYAMALAVEEAWTHKFTAAVGMAVAQQSTPTWYHGSGTTGRMGLAGIGNSLGSALTSQISSASTPPGSSSGGGGGGFSGGGGGGGGGGGR
jgi:uncharacterized membrane protein YgcG